VGQTVCSGVEVAVRELLIPEHQGDGVGGALHLQFEQLVNAQRRHREARALLPQFDP